jgi:MFS family permease
MMSVGLAQYAVALGYSGLQAGVIASSALIGTTITTLLVGQYAERLGRRRVLILGSLLTIASGLAYASTTLFPVLLAVAFFGTINPTSGDVSSFLPVEQAMLGQEPDPARRVHTFAWFNVAGTLAGAAGALTSGSTVLLRDLPGVGEVGAIRLLFAAYSVLGLGMLALVLRLGPEVELAHEERRRGGLGPSRRRVFTLSGLFMVDSFAGSLVVQSIIALYLLREFGFSASTTGAVFFVTGLLQAGSFLAAARLANRFGLVNTMVFTHLPSNLLLIGVAVAPTAWFAVALLFLRSMLSQMDVAPRQALIVSVVHPEERAAAAAITGTSRSLAATVGPSLGGALLGSVGAGVPFIAAGALKSLYDLGLLALFGRKAEAPPQSR